MPSIDDLFVDEIPQIAKKKRKIEDDNSLATTNKRLKISTDYFTKNFCSKTVKYYAQVFPYSEIFQLFCKKTKKREFGFQLKTKNSIFKLPEKFIRKINFFSEKAMKKFFLNNLPDDVYVGSFNKNCLSLSEKTMAELKFDFDINLYDVVRTCCKNENICQKCFKFLVAGYEILNYILETQFNYSKVFWTFSGNRGLHCWVFDDLAQCAIQIERDYIVKLTNYNSIKMKYNNNLKNCIPNSINDIFINIINENESILTNESGMNTLITCLSTNELKDKFSQICANIKNSLLVWFIYLGFLETYVPLEKQNIICYVISYFLFPKIDIPVTNQVNHLLRLPFTVNSKSGNVCLPILPNTIRNLNIENMPNIFLNNVDINALKIYIDYMNLFLSKL